MFKKVLIVLMIGCFLLGMATKEEAENAVGNTTTIELEKTAASDENRGMVPLEKWERNRRVDDKVYKIAGELEEICEKNNNNYEAIGWSMSAARLVGELKELGEDALPAIYDVAKDTGRSELLRMLMTERLAFSYEPAVTKPLINFLMNKSESERMKVNVAELLGRILKDTIATPALIKTMEDKSNPDNVRDQAAHAFVFIHDERAIKPLLENIKSDPSLDVKRISISALGAIGRDTDNREMVNPLLAIVEKGEKVQKGANDYSEIKTLQYHAISSLGAIKERRIVPILSRKVEGEDMSNLYVAIWALGNIGGSEAQNTLLKLLNHDSEGIRFDAAKALLKIGDRSVVSDIEKVLPTLEVYQRNMLSDSLRKIKERER